MRDLLGDQETDRAPLPIVPDYRERLPDAETSGWTAFDWQSVRLPEGKAPMAVGDRRHRAPDAGPADRSLTIYSSPETIVWFWPARLFRVGALVGVERRSFRSGTSGWCQGYTVLEELPAHLVFGPGGERAVAIAERAAALDTASMLALGEVAKKMAWWEGEPAREALKAARAALLGDRPRYDEPRDPAALHNFVEWAFIHRAWEIERESGPGHLVDVVDGCVREWVLMDGTWRAGLRACVDAIDAAMWADRLEPAHVAWLAEPWRTVIGTDD